LFSGHVGCVRADCSVVYVWLVSVLKLRRIVRLEMNKRKYYSSTVRDM